MYLHRKGMMVLFAFFCLPICFQEWVFCILKIFVNELFIIVFAGWGCWSFRGMFFFVVDLSWIDEPGASFILQPVFIMRMLNANIWPALQWKWPKKFSQLLPLGHVMVYSKFTVFYRHACLSQQRILELEFLWKGSSVLMFKLMDDECFQQKSVFHLISINFMKK